ncbi:MAG: DUF1801 domain-containing protein [Flammeovirgaceae bacterium]|nr:DUF1801 domain-containing protein [Flammeovirgaceae bacterium]MDW8288020.1 DUF1801 domain-containing protein [Flammeovirgaceae bacterium]
MSEELDDFLRQFSPEVAHTAKNLFELAASIMLPEKKVWIDHADKMIVFGTEKTMKGEICYIRPLKDAVNLGFFHATALPDPHGLLQGMGKMLRHVKVKKKTSLPLEPLRELLQNALNEHNERLNLS